VPNQVASEAIHTENPGLFFVFYISPKADGLDKVTPACNRARGGPFSFAMVGGGSEAGLYRRWIGHAR